MNKHRNLFVFDVETVPDLMAAKNLLGGDDNFSERLTQYHLDITNGNNAFIRQPFHKVVSICFLEAEIHTEGDNEYYVLKDIRAGGKPDASEKELIQGFFQHLSTLRARLVSFNGRTFDLPVLKYRAMLYGVQAPWLYKSGDKWNSYNSRYSLDWHCDLLDALSDFGASARVKMQEVCAMLGLPGKLDIDGSYVESLYNQGEIAQIRDYCEIDVLNTYLLYLRYMFLTGTLSRESYSMCITDVVAFLESNLETRTHFGKFLEEWAEHPKGFEGI